MVIYKNVRRGLHKAKEVLRFMFKQHPFAMNVFSASVILPLGDSMCQAVNLYLGDTKHYNFQHTCKIYLKKFCNRSTRFLVKVKKFLAI